MDDIMQKSMVIYLLTDTTNGMRYVGQTTQTLRKRIKEHRRKHGTYIDRAIKAHGWENFTVGVLEQCSTLDELNDRERYWIATLNTKSPNGYNLTDGGEGFGGFKRTGEKHPKYGKPAANRGTSPYKNLLCEMDARQITYTALARLMGFSSHKYVSLKIRGRSNFTDRDKAQLVEIFGKPIEYLLARDDR